jgi:hypothetical protein
MGSQPFKADFADTAHGPKMVSVLLIDLLDSFSKMKSRFGVRSQILDHEV